MVFDRDFDLTFGAGFVKYGCCRCASAMYFFSTGDQVLVEA